MPCSTPSNCKIVACKLCFHRVIFAIVICKKKTKDEIISFGTPDIVCAYYLLYYKDVCLFLKLQLNKIFSVEIHHSNKEVPLTNHWLISCFKK